MINFDLDTKYKIDFTTNFKQQVKKMVKQDKNIQELLEIITRLANKEKLEPKYKDHSLINDKTYKECRECHIRPDWLLIYKYEKNRLVIVLLATGSHSELFNK